MSIFRRLRWVYKKLRLRRLRYGLPFVILAAYTIFGAYVFRHFELEWDELRRISYRKNTEYAFDQVINRIMKVRCKDKLLRDDQMLQASHTKDALLWLINYLNLTQVIEERVESSPWTWPGAMFYAGQLYTTIGYGLPAAQTPGGRLASILYIMFGIPIFLIILAQVGKVLSRALRKVYKQMRTAKDKFPEEMSRKMSEPVKAIYNLTPSLLSNGGISSPLKNLRKSTTSSGVHRNIIISDNENNSNKDGRVLNSKSNTLVEFDNFKSDNFEVMEKLNELNDKQNDKIHNKKSQAFPIPMALTILILWIAFSSAMFCVWEPDWGYLTSVYFFFVSISTVGLGDIVPTRRNMMFINFMLILIGLALLSMCINLIQNALERLIEELIEEYIDEIEKIAAVVTNSDEFAEEATAPFEVGMTAEMLTVPITSLDKQAHDNSNDGTWRSVKDWIAGQIASNILMNRLDPQHSSDSEGDYDSDSDLNEMENVVVTSYEEPKLFNDKVKVNIVKNTVINKVVGVPTIAVHEGTPMSEIYEFQLKPLAKDAVSFVSEGRRGKQQKKLRGANINLFSSFNKSTIRAIQAIETAKMRTYRDGDFKSRLFAKFATSQRLANLVDNQIASNAEHQKNVLAAKLNTKMVSSCCQTTPLPLPKQNNTPSGYVARNFTLESMDSMSLDIPVSNSNHDWMSTSVFDIDSLYSNGYFDMSFGTYSTDSVPKLMAELNTPLPQNVHSTSKMPFKKNCRYSFRSGVHLNNLRVTGNDIASMKMSTVAALMPFSLDCTLPLQQNKNKLATYQHGASSVPGSPLIFKQDVNMVLQMPCEMPIESPSKNSLNTLASSYLFDNDELINQNIVHFNHQQPINFLTTMRSQPTAPMSTPTTSPIVGQKTQNRSGYLFSSKSALLLASIPLHHRALCNRRRFSDNNCLAPKNAYLRNNEVSNSALLTTLSHKANAKVLFQKNFCGNNSGNTLASHKNSLFFGSDFPTLLNDSTAPE